MVQHDMAPYINPPNINPRKVVSAKTGGYVHEYPVLEGYNNSASSEFESDFCVDISYR